MKKRLCLLLAFLLLLFGLSVSGVLVKAESSKFFTIYCNPGEDSNNEMRVVLAH